MKPREIEQTSKKLKSHIVCSYLLWLIGIVIYCVADDNMKADAMLFMLLFWLVGGTWYIVTKFRVWWNHS